MCSTCGCGNDAHITMTKPGEKPVFYHPHEETVLHRHPHHENTQAHHLHNEDEDHTRIDNGHTHTHDGHTHTHTNDGHIHPATHLSGRMIEIEQDILFNNTRLAERNRGYFEALSITALNFVSSPGSGKTTLLEKTLGDLASEFKMCVIEGDQQTSNDADRIAKFNIPVIQINTGKMCHLDAQMIHQAVQNLQPQKESFLFIENVGNLVCPAMFDLGEKKRVVIMSVTEGTDKAIKYPEMFHTSDLCIINKTDLLPYVDFDVEKAKELALRVNHNLKFIELSATKGDGLDNWYAWLKQQALV